jgi:urease accessory protein
MAAAAPALAHTGEHHFSGFAAGFVHPFGGMDHVLAMVSVGLFAALMGGRAVWSVPVSFIAMMLVGGALGMAGFIIPAFEVGIAASVIVLGALVTWGKQLAPVAAMTLVGFFAVFHGYAHGVEIPAGNAGLAYSVGFTLASLCLHILGLLAGTSLLKHGPSARLSGVAVTLAGLWVAFG